MASRFVRPETVRIPISDGDWIEVKKRLTAGERRALLARIYTAGVNGDLKVNPLETGLANVVVYLVDWSVKGDDGKIVKIRDLSSDALAAVIDGLDPDSFTEIKDAIEKHDDAMEKERVAEKNGQSGGNGSPAISPSLVDVAGVTSGSLT